VNLEKAKASGDTKRVEKAQEEYDLTPAGIRDIKKSGDFIKARNMLRKRREMIQEVKNNKRLLEYIEGQMREFEGDEYHGYTLNQIKLFTKKYGQPWVGRTRAVFDRGDGYVIKVPMNGEGYAANNAEVINANMDDPYIPVANCWHEEAYDITPKGVPTLVMEKVEHCKADYKNMPDWVMSVDGGQVGYDKNGRLVAYDL
jgi:hypothetical protein